MAKSPRRERSTSPSGTPATVALTRAGVEFTLHAYDHTDTERPGHDYARASAHALGLAIHQVFKTLLVRADTEHVVAVTPADAELDLKALARAAGAKRAGMAEPATATRLTGYVLGGISPLGQRTRLRTFVDTSATDLDRVYVSAGRRGLSLAVGPADLVRVTGAELAPIAVR